MSAERSSTAVSIGWLAVTALLHWLFLLKRNFCLLYFPSYLLFIMPFFPFCIFKYPSSIISLQPKVLPLKLWQILSDAIFPKMPLFTIFSERWVHWIKSFWLAVFITFQHFKDANPFLSDFHCIWWEDLENLYHCHLYTVCHFSLAAFRISFFTFSFQQFD